MKNTPLTRPYPVSRLLKGVGANAYAQLVTVCIQLLSIPLFLHYWGPQIYGEWLILSTIPVYLSLSDIGFASVAGNEMTMQVAQGDLSGSLVVYQSIWVLITSVSLIAGVIVFLLAWLLPMHQFFSLLHVGSEEVTITLGILLLHVVVGMQGGVFSAGYRANGRYAQLTVLNNTVRLFEFVLSALMLANGGGIVAVALALLTAKVLGTIWIWMELRKVSSQLFLGWRAAELNVIRRLFRPAIAFLAFPIGFALNIQGMVLLIGALLGPTSVTIFTAYRTMSRLVVQLTALLNNAVSPELSAAYGAGAIDVVKVLHRKASFVTFWLGLLALLCLELVGTRLVDFWTDRAFEPNIALSSLLLVAAFLNILSQTSCTTLMAVNWHQLISLVFIGSAVAVLGLSVPLISIFGLCGAAIAIIIGELPILYFSIRGGLRVSADKWPGYFRTVILGPVAPMRK